MKIRQSKIMTGSLFLLFCLFTFLVISVDIEGVGPAGSKVGFATINQWIHQKMGVHFIWYHITDWLGFVPLAVGFVFSIMGLCQLLKRKSLWKVDRDIVWLGIVLALMIGAYIFFEKCIVNYRPVLMDGYLEASYPSSHTMLVIGIMGAATLPMKKRLGNMLPAIFSAAVISITVIGRLISGVHWFTDIIGGLLLGAFFVSLYVSGWKVIQENPK